MDRTNVVLCFLAIVIQFCYGVTEDECVETYQVSSRQSNIYHYKCGWLGWWTCTGTRYYIKVTTMEVCCSGYTRINGKCLRPTSSASDICGIQSANPASDVAPFIVGGTDAFSGQYPWLVMLRGNTYLCTGVIIDERWILTSASCVRNWNQTDFWSKYKLYLGQHNYDQVDTREIIMAMEKFFAHEQFNRTNYQNNIALIKTVEPIVFNDYVKPICLPSADQTFPVNTSVEIAGWGWTQPGPPSSSMTLSIILQRADMLIADITLCKNSYSDSYFAGREICVTDGEGDTQRAPCFADDPTPLMLRHNDIYYVIGLQSSRVTDCASGKPPLFIDVTKYLDWIEQIRTSN